MGLSPLSSSWPSSVLANEASPILHFIYRHSVRADKPLWGEGTSYEFLWQIQ